MVDIRFGLFAGLGKLTKFNNSLEWTERSVRFNNSNFPKRGIKGRDGFNVSHKGLIWQHRKVFSYLF